MALLGITSMSVQIIGVHNTLLCLQLFIHLEFEPNSAGES